MRKVAERVEGTDRFVDIGVVLHVVVPDVNGEELIDGMPLMRILRTTRHGGMVDTKLAKPALVGPSINPRVWFCSEQQEKALFHRDQNRMAQLIYGSEGAGKTRLLAMCHYFRWLEFLGEFREGGQTAPTMRRLGLVREEMQKAFRSNWGRYVARDDFEGWEMCDGTRIRFVSTHRQSTADGSPIQGFSWSWCNRDEMQDQTEVHEDIESRGRAAKGGLYPQMGTATAKDDSKWRDLRDAVLASGRWAKQTLSIFHSPFVDPKFLSDKKATISSREFLRRYGNPATGEVDDLPPELAVYYAWIRKRNLVRAPQIATDVTASVLANYQSYVRRGTRFTLVAAHDPGNIYNTTTVLRLLMFGNVPTWVVIGELQTEQTTAREHAAKLRKYLIDSFSVDLYPTEHEPNPRGGKALVFCDPHGRGETQTDYQSVYLAFQKEGLDVFSPAATTGRIKKKARVEMMNRLLGDNEGGIPRLVVATDEFGRPVAPRLVEAFESLKKKAGDDNPEGTRRKDDRDQTHAPAATSYGLWMFEQEALTESTIKIAIAEAKKVRSY